MKPYSVNPHICVVLCTCAFLLLNLSCASYKNVEPNIEFQKEWIELIVVADDSLNSFDGEPYDLKLVICQLRERNPYAKYSKEEEDLKNIFLREEGPPEDLEKARTIHDSFVISPGQTLVRKLDRFEGTQFIAIIAGYYKMQPGLVNRIMTMPTKQNGEKLRIRLRLGPTQIEEASSNDGNFE